MGRKKSNMDNLYQSNILIIQVQSLQVLSGTTEYTGWTFWPSKDKYDNFINLSFFQHLKPTPASLWELSTLLNTDYKQPFFSSQRMLAAKFFGHRHKETMVTGMEFIRLVLIEWI